MRSIVTAIDGALRERVEDAWSEIKAVFNLRRELAGQTEPRIVLQVAGSYSEELDRVLGAIAAATPAFEVQTGDAAILKGPRHLIYVPVEPSVELAALHERLWHELAPLSHDAKAAYAPSTWAPHLTLAMGHLREAMLPELRRFLAARAWRWRLPITNLCRIDDAASPEDGWRRWELAAARTAR